MKVIDLRSRPPYKTFAQDFIYDADYLEMIYGKSQYDRKVPKSALNKSMDDFIAEKEAAGVERCVVPIRGKRAETDNQLVVELLNEYPNHFIGMAAISMPGQDIQRDLDIIRQYVIDGPCTGINMEPILDANIYSMDDEKIYPIYEICEKNDIPLLYTSGGVAHGVKAPFDFSMMSPMKIEHVCYDFPKLKIIAAHAGWPWTILMCAAALKWDNLYISPDCYLMEGIGRQNYVDAINRYDMLDKVMFGTVYPTYDMQWAIDYYKNCGIREDALPKLLYENAARVFKLDKMACDN